MSFGSPIISQREETNSEEKFFCDFLPYLTSKYHGTILSCTRYTIIYNYISEYVGRTRAPVRLAMNISPNTHTLSALIGTAQ